MRTYFLISFFLLTSFALHAVQPVAAVLEIEDKSGKMEKSVIWNATDYLRTKLVAGGGFIVVDKTKQETKLRELVKKSKKSSHDLDKDPQFQIPLGKSLSAQVLIRSRITSFAGKFTFAIEIIDVAKEAVIGGGSAEFVQSEESLATAIDSVVATLRHGSAEEKPESRKTPSKTAETEIRALLFTKVTVDGTKKENNLLEGSVAPVLQDSKFYLVDAGKALKAKSAVFAEEIQNGKIPKELSVLEADSVISVIFSCTTVSEKIRNTKLKGFSCNFSTKMIRMDNGEIVLSKSENIPAHGLTADQAMNMIIEDQVKTKFAQHTKEIKEKWSKGGTWELDVVVTRLADRVKAEKIAVTLKDLKGVNDSKMVVFNTEYVKFRLYGDDQGELSKVKSSLFSDKSIPLKVVHETARTVHAQYNSAALFSRDVDVYYSMNTGGYGDDFVSGVLGSFLSNVEYFSVNSISRAKSKDESIKTGAASKQKYILFMNFENIKNVWRASTELIDTSSKERLLVASGDGESMFAAADMSSKELEKMFKGSVEKPFAQKFFKDKKEAMSFVATDELLINEFSVNQIMPALIAHYRKSGVGTIVLENRSDKILENVNIQYLIKESVAGSEKITALKPKEIRTVAVKLNVVPENRSFSQLQAAVTYEAATVFKRSDAYTPLIIHDKNTVDWSNPKSVASFIDASSKSVRESATSALKSSKLPEGFLTDKLAKAALIYSALWHKPLTYIADPVTPGSNVGLDTVQTPYETISRKAGDCDDLTVLLASLFESVGLSTAVIVAPGHVFPAVETGLLKGGEVIFGLPESLFITIDGALYIPIEATAPGTSFQDAWSKGAETVSKDKKNISAFRVREAWKKYPSGISADKTEKILETNKVNLTEISSTVAELRKTASNVPQWSIVLNEHFLTGKTPLPEISDIKKSLMAKALVSWMKGDRNSAVKDLDKMCESGNISACYNIVSLILFEHKGEISNGLEIYENTFAQLPTSVIDMMLETGGYGLGDETSEKAKMNRKIQEILKKAQKIINKKGVDKDRNKIRTSFVSGTKGDDISKNKELFLLLFWGEL